MGEKQQSPGRTQSLYRVSCLGWGGALQGYLGLDELFGQSWGKLIDWWDFFTCRVGFDHSSTLELAQALTALRRSLRKSGGSLATGALQALRVYKVYKGVSTYGRDRLPCCLSWCD